MNPSLAFWTAALIDLLAVVVLIAIGVRSIRRGNLSLHRRCMKGAATLIACFLGIYPLKVLCFGREQLSEWSEPAVVILRIHEFCVFAMVVGGLTALILSRKMHSSRSQLAQLPQHGASAGKGRGNRTAESRLFGSRKPSRADDYMADS